MNEKIKILKIKAKEVSPTLRIGKNGINEGVLNEIKKQLKVKQLIKIKFLKSFFNENELKEVFTDIAKETESEIVDMIGHMLVLYKERKSTFSSQ